jgi:hypothetical protein
VITETVEPLYATPAHALVQSIVVNFEHRGSWLPVARLSRRGGRYTFQYTTGALQFGSTTRAIPFKAFPKLTQRYESRELFALFADAIPGAPQSDAREQFMAARGLDSHETDPMTILAVPTPLDSTGTLMTMPNLRGDENRRFDFRVMLRGPAPDSLMARNLRPGQPLWLHANTAADARKASVVIIDERREVVDALLSIIAQELAPVLTTGTRPTVELVRINETAQSPSERLLIRIRGQWPDRYEPMQRVAFSPILI